MTVALELRAALERAGRSAVFVATGQTGVAIAGEGISIDAVVADFIAGAAEQLVCDAAERAEWVVVEGQGSLTHPGFSGVTLGLLHGSVPDACSPAMRPAAGEGRGELPLSRSRAVRVYEEAAAWSRRQMRHEAQVTRCAEHRRSAGQRGAALCGRARTGLPAADPAPQAPRRRPPRPGGAGPMSLSAPRYAIDVPLPNDSRPHVRTEKRVVILEVDDGTVVARGEASPDPYFGETSDDLERAVRGAVGLLPADPADLATLKAALDLRFPHGGAAACALDIAAHDRAAQHAGVPLRAWLGLGTVAPPTSFTIGLADPATMAERAARAAGRGFEVLKVKLGRDDVGSWPSARGAGLDRVDPNAAWSPDRRSRIGRSCPSASSSSAAGSAGRPRQLRAVTGARRSSSPTRGGAPARRRQPRAAARDQRKAKSGGLGATRAMVARAHALG